MNIRILHCSTSIENYNVCIKEKVVGFSQRGAEPGDLVYIVVNIDKVSLCGARGILGEITDYKPWADSDRYRHCLYLENLEFCTPFDIKRLSDVGGKKWALKYVQSSKPIRDEKARQLLDEVFLKNKQESFYRYIIDEKEDTEQEKSDDIDSVKDEISIMGTFQTINFLNETDEYRGLETLVNQNFHHLFPVYAASKSILITENRMFKTKGLDLDESIAGIRGIPDGILIEFDKKNQNYLKINLIEYECYGEKKTKAAQKSNYFNGHIIPQLMRFASTFSIVTDKSIRERTIEDWVNKIIDYIYFSPEIVEKITTWIREVDKDISEQRIALKLKDLLVEGFKANVRIMLIIDELTGEQNDTIRNVINAFKLENGSAISFIGYTVRLEQKITVLDSKSEYALSVQ
ncbi:MAG: hypothetical protein E6590_14015 [Clostridiales bacterium]|uniref:hypothetical protein n=1 Tax=Zhenhengia sp. TaxID=2944208 RepID=UPI00290EF122|nr:hypothetical protein [Clostridiales bacterium]